MRLDAGPLVSLKSCDGCPVRPRCEAKLDIMWLDGMRMATRDGAAGIKSLVFERDDGWIVRVMLHDAGWAVTHAACPRCSEDMS